MHRFYLSALLGLGLLLGLAPSASAKGTVCQHVEEDMFTVDGMLDDWESFSPTSYGTRKVAADDAELRLHCAYDKDKLYLLLDVRDERVYRTKAGKAADEDRIDIELQVGSGKAIKLDLLPGASAAKRKILSSAKPAAMGITLEDSLQPKGFSVKLSVPLRKLAGWSPSVPYLSGRVLFHDADGPSDKRGKVVVGLKGKLHFSDAAETYKAFMRAAGLRNNDVRLDELADVDPGAGPERVIIGGKIMGVVGTSFNFMGLPIDDAKDLKSAQLVDFDGAGRKAVLTELTQHGNGGSRDVLIVWFAKGDGSFAPALTIETRKERNGASIANSWSLVPRQIHREGARKPKKNAKPEPGHDLLVQLAEVVGFTADNYREAPATDARVILTPWSEQTSAVYYLDGTNASGGGPAANLPEPKSR